MKFLDEAKIFVQSGAGGNGCMSFRREANVEYGGPDGGDGGRGGHVYLEAVDNLNTLFDFRYQQHYKARRGQGGMGKNRTGAGAEDIVIKVPVGTEVLDETKEFIIADLVETGEQVMIAEGGQGGAGNTRFKSSINRAPRRTTPGGDGEEQWIWLRLKLLADVGLIGLPNAGKSTFLAATSKARPKIADYPFTTLAPQLGIVSVGERNFVLADIPGLIEGAHEGIGLGDRFLGHVERCRVLVHLIDLTGDDVVGAWRMVRNEIIAYGAGLEEKDEIIALSKSDISSEKDIAAARALLEAETGCSLFVISAATGEGLPPLLNALADKTAAYAKAVRPRTSLDDSAPDWSPV